MAEQPTTPKASLRKLAGSPYGTRYKKATLPDDPPANPPQQPPAGPPGPPGPPDDPAAMDQDQHQGDQGAGVSGSQIATVPTFDGDEGHKSELWCMGLTDAMTQFAWTELEAVKTAERKLTGPAQSWYYRMRCIKNQPYATWTGDEGLRAAMLKRFYPGRLARTVAADLTNLKQRSTETVSQFQDRCFIVCDRKFSATPEEKALPTYEARVNKEVYFYMVAGIKKEIRLYINAGATRHTNLEEFFEAATTAEQALEEEKGLAPSAICSAEPRATSDADNAIQISPVEQQLKEALSKIEALEVKVRQGAAGNPRKKTPSAKRPPKCSFCNKAGHAETECWSKHPNLRPQSSRPRGAGRSNGGPAKSQIMQVAKMLMEAAGQVPEND